MYRVKIRPIATDIEIVLGHFETEEAAWQWVDQHNWPFADYDVVYKEGEENDDT